MAQRRRKRWRHSCQRVRRTTYQREYFVFSLEFRISTWDLEFCSCCRTQCKLISTWNASFCNNEVQTPIELLSKGVMKWNESKFAYFCVAASQQLQYHLHATKLHWFNSILHVFLFSTLHSSCLLSSSWTKSGQEEFFVIFSACSNLVRTEKMMKNVLTTAEKKSKNCKNCTFHVPKVFDSTIRAIQFDFDRGVDWKSSCGSSVTRVLNAV